MARKKSAAKKAREAEGAGAAPAAVVAVAKPVTAKPKAAPKSKSAKIDMGGSDSDSDSEDEMAFTINEDYAKKFQYNKEREELVRLQEKQKKGFFQEKEESDYSDDSTSEDEDEDADLATADVDAAIANVIQTIRNNPGKLLEKNVNFFDEVKEDGSGEASAKKEKPMYLKDYHRKTLLEGGVGEDDDENEHQGQKPYAIQQEEDRARLVSEIHGQADEDDEDDEDDGFLTKRKEVREIEEVELPDPEKDGEGFLDQFITSKAWVAKDEKPTYDDIVEDEEDEFEEKADQFEQEYNFRFQEEDGKEIVSYGRNQDTVRRSTENTRKRQRETKAERKAEEKRERDAEKARFKKLMVKDVMRKMETLKKFIGDDASKFSEADFEGEFDDTEWDKKMQQVFNEEYYAGDTEKPKWDDEVDMGDIVVPDSDDEDNDNDDDDEAGEDEDVEMEQEDEEEEEEETPAISKRKQKALEKQQKKQEAKDILAKATAFVEENVDLAIDKEEARGRKPVRDEANEVRFRYREVSPESYGLTANDILLADDKQLNEFVGLKKLASYRAADKKAKDQRKYGKKKRLKDWRQEVFKKRDAPTDEEIMAAVQKQQKGKRRK